MTATLGLAMPLMMLGWGLVILIGGVVAFSVYAILAGNREEKQYKSSALPETEMMQELKASVEESNTDADSLESVDLDSMAPAAPLPVPVAMPDAGAAAMSGPELPGPAVPDLGLPGPDSQWPAADYAGPTGTPQGMPGLPGAPQGMPLPDMGMPGAPSAPQPANAAFPPMPTMGAATMPTMCGAASPGAASMPGMPGAASMPGAGDVLSTLDGMIDSAGAGSGQAAAPVNPFKGR